MLFYNNFLLSVLETVSFFNSTEYGKSDGMSLPWLDYITWQMYSCDDVSLHETLVFNLEREIRRLALEKQAVVLLLCCELPVEGVTW